MSRRMSLFVLAVLLIACRADPAAEPTARASQPSAPAATMLASRAPLATPTGAATAATGTPVAASPASQSVGPATPAATTEQAALVEGLRRGGYVIFFRHAATDLSQNDSDPNNLANCATQRNLHDQGRAQSQAIGAAFRALEIPVGQVLTSAYCRTRDMADLAFGRGEISSVLTGLTGLDEAERNRRLAGLKELLATRPEPGRNTVLISHQFNLLFATEITLETEGEAAIFQPNGVDGANGTGFRLVARVLPDEWEALRRSLGR